MKKILTIGDLILDIYNHGSAIGVSLETPTLVVHHQDRKVSYGGAGLFVRNILELGGEVIFLTLLGDDDGAVAAHEWTHEHLEKHFIVDPGRQTTSKERFWVKTYKVLQWDHLDNRPISPETEKSIITFVKEKIESIDKIMVSDYRHGLITESLAKQLVDIAGAADVPIYLDSQVSKLPANHHWYKGMTVVCLNEKEALSVDSQFTESDLVGSLKRLKEMLSARDVILKLGEKGSVALIGDAYHEIPPHNVVAVDTTGAGDAFFASLAVSSGPLTPEVLAEANHWAALSTTTMGPNPPQRVQLTDR